MKNFLHEWRMNRKIKRILAYNKKHPERCFSASTLVPQPTQQETGVLTYEDFTAFLSRLKEGDV